MRTKFASLKEPAKYGYAFDTDAWDYRAPLSYHMQQFETYGDGLTQHSGEWPVQVEFLTDYLASLATTMLNNDPEYELTAAVAREILQAPCVKEIEFCASIVFKTTVRADGQETGYEKKTRWFSVGEKKISASPEKRHDKRYQEVEAWCDGSADAIYRMLIEEHDKGLKRYAYADAIRNWFMDTPDSKPYYGGMPAQFLKWFDDTNKARELRYAFDTCKHICEAYQHRCSATCSLANLHWPVEVKAEETTQEVAL